MPRATMSNSSPFYRRAYAGYTRGQEEFYRTFVNDPTGKSIFDPMCGQGHAISELAFEGANLWLGDINPALLLLVNLRDAQLIADIPNIYSVAEKFLAPFKKYNKSANVEYIEDWISPNILFQLHEYGDKLRNILPSSPFSYDHDFWLQDTYVKFLACLPILAARELVHRFQNKILCHVYSGVI